MVKKIVFYISFFVILLIGLVSCNGTVTKNKQESHVIVKIWWSPSLDFYNNGTPRYKALLSNGDTVPCSPEAREGDTIYYKYYKIKQ